jgi:hypothetical protein
VTKNQNFRTEIHQALLSQFYLLAEFFIGKVQVKERESRVLTLENLNPVQEILQVVLLDLYQAIGGPLACKVLYDGK